MLQFEINTTIPMLKSGLKPSCKVLFQIKKRLDVNIVHRLTHSQLVIIIFLTDSTDKLNTYSSHPASNEYKLRICLLQ